MRIERLLAYVTHTTPWLKCSNISVHLTNLEQAVEYWKQNYMSWFMEDIEEVVVLLTKSKERTQTQISKQSISRISLCLNNHIWFNFLMLTNTSSGEIRSRIWSVSTQLQKHWKKLNWKEIEVIPIPLSVLFCI